MGKGHLEIYSSLSQPRKACSELAALSCNFKVVLKDESPLNYDALLHNSIYSP